MNCNFLSRLFLCACFLRCCGTKLLYLFLCWQIVLPTVVMLMLIAVRTQVDTRLHPAQPYVSIALFQEFMLLIFSSDFLSSCCVKDEVKERNANFPTCLWSRSVEGFILWPRN